MLRSLSLAARHYAPGGPCRTLIRGLSAETTTAQVQNPPKAKGDSEFVRRRREYRKCLHERRVVLQSELQREEVKDIEKDREEIAAARQARLERKRATSEAKQVRAKELADGIRKVKEERQAYRKDEWKRKQKALKARRAGVVQTLVDRSHEWITEETLQEHVDKAVDEFFIEVREDERGPKVVGW